MRKGLECRQRTQEEGGKLKAGRHEEAGPCRAGAGGELEWGPGIAEGDPWKLAGFPRPWEPHTSPGLGLCPEEEDTALPPLPVSLFSLMGKEYIKAVYFHAAYFNYMQTTSCEMPG